MNGFASVVVAGNLTRDVVLKYAPSGIAIGEFSLAVNETHTKEGEKRKEVSFFDVVCFGENCRIRRALPRQR